MALGSLPWLHRQRSLAAERGLIAEGTDEIVLDVRRDLLAVLGEDLAHSVWVMTPMETVSCAMAWPTVCSRTSEFRMG